MPTEKAVTGWAQYTPAGFVFALKVPRRITHFARLRGIAEPLQNLLDTVRGLGAKLGPLLLQLPPNFRKDARPPRRLPRAPAGDRRMAVEFRHASWLDDEVYSLLRSRNAGPLRRRHRGGDDARVPTAGFRYLRLRDRRYGPAEARPVGGRRRPARVARRVRVLQASRSRGPGRCWPGSRVGLPGSGGAPRPARGARPAESAVARNDVKPERAARDERVERVAGDQREKRVVRVPQDLHGLRVDDERVADRVVVPRAARVLEAEPVAGSETPEEAELACRGGRSEPCVARRAGRRVPAGDQAWAESPSIGRSRRREDDQVDPPGPASRAARSATCRPRARAFDRGAARLGGGPRAVEQARWATQALT